MAVLHRKEEEEDAIEDAVSSALMRLSSSSPSPSAQVPTRVLRCNAHTHTLRGRKEHTHISFPMVVVGVVVRRPSVMSRPALPCLALPCVVCDYA